MDQLDELSQHTESVGGLTRTYLTPQHKAAGRQLVQWMNEAGMQTRTDNAGNVIGRFEASIPDQPALLIGSHFDTVRNAGKYDGTYGLLAGIACVHELNENNERLPFAIEVLGFSEEEGVRYNATLLGSRAIAGNFDYALLDTVDADGISLSAAIRNYGLNPDRLHEAAYDPAQVLAFVELHIEQGPVLVTDNHAVGTVSAIAGATRFNVVVTGKAGHAGTVPMALRQDAAAAAAEVLLFLEELCSKKGGDLVGTVGQLNVPEGAANIIPASARFSIDIRSGSDALRKDAIRQIGQYMETVSRKRSVTFAMYKTHDANAVKCDDRLNQQLANAALQHRLSPPTLLSGAGHDAMAMAELTDIAMLFVRCGNNGISHHPDEIMTADDAQIAAQVLLTFIRQFSPLDNTISN